MIAMDWSALALGAMIGAVASTLFFAGLGLGLRLALRAARPAGVLAVSSIVRITALLAAGWGVAALIGPPALAGFAAAFVLTRTIVTTLARAGLPAEPAP